VTVEQIQNRESFQLFRLLDSHRTEVTQKLAQIRPMTKEEQEAMVAARRLNDGRHSKQRRVLSRRQRSAARADFDEADETT
jgi:preprotein translocase subunit SecA